MAPLPLSELIRRVGDDHVAVQNLFENCTGIRQKKRTKQTPATTLVTFATSPNFMTPNDLLAWTRGDKPSHVGMAIWLPQPLVESATSGEQTAPPGGYVAVNVPGGWRPLSAGYPPNGNLLVTNNLHARNSYGQMSHIWIGHPIASVEHACFICYNEADRIIQNLTHWHPMPGGELAGSDVDRLARRVLSEM